VIKRHRASRLWSRKRRNGRNGIRSRDTPKNVRKGKLTAVLTRGNGSAFQRNAYRDATLSCMVDSAATATTR